MSFFSWFTRKPAPALADASQPSGPLRNDATGPGNSQGRQGRAPQDTSVQEQLSSRKNERMERRELLYTVVRDAMVRAGVLSASYKFKVLSLDQRGSQFLVMMDVAREFGGDTARLSEIEALIAQTAKSRYDIAVTAVYWRVNDHVAVGIPLRGAAGVASAAAATPPSAQRPVTPPDAAAGQMPPMPGASSPSEASGPAVALPGLAASPVASPVLPPALTAPQRAAVRVIPPPGFDPIEADEVAAFRKALGNTAARPVAKRKPLGADDFADTEMTGNAAPAPDLGATQYGDL